MSRFYPVTIGDDDTSSRALRVPADIARRRTNRVPHVLEPSRVGLRALGSGGYVGSGDPDDLEPAAATDTDDCVGCT